jgi:hypothetical protein
MDLLLVEFYELWKNNEKPDTRVKDHMKTLTTILACIESSETGRRVNVEEFRRSPNCPEEWMDKPFILAPNFNHQPASTPV